MSGWLAALSAATDVGMGIYNTERSRSAANATRDWNEYMYDKNNAYNTPLAQRQRLVDAGLNPALMYQTMPQNTSSPVTSGAMAQPNMRSSGTVASNVLAGYQAENIQAQTQNVRADTERKMLDIENERINAPIRTQGLGLDNTNKDVNNQINQIERTHREESLILKNQGMDLNNQTTQKALSQMDAKFKNEMAKMLAEIGNIIQQTATGQTQAALNLKNIEGINSRMNVDRSIVKRNDVENLHTQVKTIVDQYEAQARRAGWSYSDNILLRQIADVMNRSSNEAYDRTGKGNKDNTNIIRSIITILSQLF